MEDLEKLLQNFVQDLDSTLDKLDIANKNEELLRLNKQTAQPDFWQDNKQAQSVTKREADLSRQIEPWLKLKALADDLKELIELGDDSMGDEIAAQLA